MFTANAAWLACAAMAYNLTRAAGAVAGSIHAKARSATLRDQLPQYWPWEAGLDELFCRALHKPLSAAA